MSTALRRLTESAKPAFRHENTWLSLEGTAPDRRFDMPYNPTYDFGADFIDGYHRFLANAPTLPDRMIDLGLEGWLLPADACKIYELTFFNPDVLELGTYRGLSSAIMSHAITNAGVGGQVVTCDLDGDQQKIAQAAHEARRIPNRQSVHYFNFEGADFVRRLYDRSDPRAFPLVFVDHSHAYEHMAAVCPILHKVTLPGGFILFHDYNDPRNPDPIAEHFGVYQAVTDHLPKIEFEFWGVFGCCGLFRRKD